MKFTKQETSMIKLAAAFIAPQCKQATLQSKLAEYGIGQTKQAYTAGQVGKIPKPVPFPRETWKEGIQSGIRSLMDPVGWGSTMVNFLNKSRAANGQMPLPTEAERRKADKIYGGVGDRIPGGVLRQPTAFDERWKAYQENREARIAARMAARERLYARMPQLRLSPAARASEQRMFDRGMERAKEGIQENWPLKRDEALRSIGLLPPHNYDDYDYASGGYR